MPHIPQKRWLSRFSFPQRPQRTLSSVHLAYDILVVRCVPVELYPQNSATRTAQGSLRSSDFCSLDPSQWYLPLPLPSPGGCMPAIRLASIWSRDALDSTTIDLRLSLFPWAKFRRRKAAVKMHTLLDLHGNIPRSAGPCRWSTPASLRGLHQSNRPSLHRVQRSALAAPPKLRSPAELPRRWRPVCGELCARFVAWSSGRVSRSKENPWGHRSLKCVVLHCVIQDDG